MPQSIPSAWANCCRIRPFMPLDPAAEANHSRFRLRGATTCTERSGRSWDPAETGGLESKDSMLLLADRIHYTPGHWPDRRPGPHPASRLLGLRLRCERLKMDWTRKQVGEAWALELELPPTWVPAVQGQGGIQLRCSHWEFDKVEV